jgi:predicted DNA-binding protein
MEEEEKKTRSVLVRLTPGTYEKLLRAARAVKRRKGELARILIEEALEELGDGKVATGRQPRGRKT